MEAALIFRCPHCGCMEKATRMDDIFSPGDIVECPDCLNLLVVKKDYSLEEFKDILANQVEKRKSAAASKLNEPDTITVRYL